MIRQWKRSLLLGLGLTVALCFAVGSSSAAAAVSTLTGESLTGAGQGNYSNCVLGGTYSVNGKATSPYAGTFAENGATQSNGDFTFSFSATFRITSGTTTVIGSKGFQVLTGGTLTCDPVEGDADLEFTEVPYSATILTPNGNFHDEGTSALIGHVTGATGTATLTESFTSSLTEPVLIAPTSKDQCKNNGWKNFPQFKNQGQCVGFVQSHGQT